MRILLLLLAFTLASPSLAGEFQAASALSDRNALEAMTKDLNSPNDGVRYRAAKRFFYGVKGFKEQNPSGLNQGDEQYEELRDLVLSLYCAMLYDEHYIRVYAIKSLRQVIDLELLPDPLDEDLVLSIWLDILTIATDPDEPEDVREAASGPL